MEVKEIVRSKQRVVAKDVRDDLLKKARKEHSKLVKGKFEFLDAQGGWLEFNYRFFPEDMLVTYKFTHGEICEIPMGLVKHLNNTMKKVRTGIPDSGNGMGSGGAFPTQFEMTSRVRFTPMDWM
tara:strand:- start:1728 stop:2099 length:372 start_codon:yes stop_codon:yes gene_type:complete